MSTIAPNIPTPTPPTPKCQSKLQYFEYWLALCSYAWAFYCNKLYLFWLLWLFFLADKFQRGWVNVGRWLQQWITKGMRIIIAVSIKIRCTYLLVLLFYYLKFWRDFIEWEHFFPIALGKSVQSGFPSILIEEPRRQ